MVNRAWILTTITVVGLSYWGSASWFSREPDFFDVASANTAPLVTGYATTNTLIQTLETLLYKPGGFIANDVAPPFVGLDNMPAWELGALEMSRDMVLALRTDFSRSQSQSIENNFLKATSPHLNMDHKRWAMPAAEDEYRKAIELLTKYRDALRDSKDQANQFYARADNLRDWLSLVEKRLGSYSQRLSASVGQERFNTDLAGDINARQSTQSDHDYVVKTTWLQIDDEFYEARGGCWALLHMLKAIEIDFADVLKQKNALVSVQQIIRELEATQQSIWTPMILNGSGFGIVANHSLVMANYISRANAALIDLNELLAKG